MAAIDRFVVLMLENRSFDHILGFYRPAPDGQPVKGLSGSESNVFDLAAVGTPLGARVTRTAGSDGYITTPGPHHEHYDVMEQLFGTKQPAAGASPLNNGFLSNYSKLEVDGVVISPDAAKQIMRCFDPAQQLPAIHALAQNFAVLDQWFSSLPGPTWPNRFFAHCATSGGLFESPSDTGAIWAEAGHSAFGMPTIYEELGAVGRDWRIYYHDIPQALALARLHDHRENFSHFSQFLRDARTGALPAYSFIEPAFFDVPAIGLVANDMHPSHDVRRGAALIADVYNALRAGPAWNQTALLVVWDEHGGFFDHVPPPPTVSPDAASDSSSFGFRRLGVRVPALLVSPRVAKGTVVSTVFDHASIPATVKALFGTTNFLSRRDAQASTLEPLLGLDVPRVDTPVAIAPAAGITATLSTPLSASQMQLLHLASALRVENGMDGAMPRGSDQVATSVVHVSRYLDV